jgi:hypothetical protein
MFELIWIKVVAFEFFASLALNLDFDAFATGF